MPCFAASLPPFPAADAPRGASAHISFAFRVLGRPAVFYLTKDGFSAPFIPRFVIYVTDRYTGRPIWFSHGIQAECFFQEALQMHLNVDVSLEVLALGV